MKKILSLLLVVLLIAGLAACEKGDTGASTTTNPSSSTTLATTTGNITTVPSTGDHAHSYQESITKEPDCKNEGEKKFVCACGDSYVEAIDKVAHNWSAWTEKKAPTDRVAGQERRKCFNCEEYEYREIPKMDRDTYLKEYGEELISIISFQIHPIQFESVNDLPALYIREIIYQKLRWDDNYTAYEHTFEGNDYPTTMHVYDVDDLNRIARMYFDMEIDWTSLNNTSDEMEYEVYDAGKKQVVRAFPGGAGSDRTYELKDIYDPEDGTFDLFFAIKEYDFEIDGETVVGGCGLILRATEHGYALISAYQYE